MKSQDIIIHDISIIMQDEPSGNLQNRILKSAAAKDGMRHTVRHNYGVKTALVAVIITLLATTTIAVAANYSKYLINKNGQTYGSGSVSDEEVANQIAQPIVLPDLILAEGIDGTIGYVYKNDLDGEQPQNPEEAVEYMKKLEERYEEMKQTGEEYVRIIPLYSEDGETVIGEFGVGSLPPMEGEGREHVEAIDQK